MWGYSGTGACYHVLGSGDKLLCLYHTNNIQFVYLLSDMYSGWIDLLDSISLANYLPDSVFVNQQNYACGADAKKKHFSGMTVSAPA